MLFIYCGENTQLAREKAWEKSQELKSDNPGLIITNIDHNDYTTSSVINAINTASLFGEKLLFILNITVPNSELNQEISEYFHKLVESDNYFILVDSKINPKTREKYKEKAQIFFETPSETVPNPFRFADALLNKDKKKLWLLLYESKQENVATHSIVGYIVVAIESVKISSANQDTRRGWT